MIKTEKCQNTFNKGIDQDTSVNKISNDVYIDADNFRIISNDPASSGALTNVNGNALKLTFNVNDTIIGYCKIRNNHADTTRDSIVFFTVNTGSPTSRIYLFEGDPGTSTGDHNMDQAYPQTTGTAHFGYIYRSSDLGFLTTYPIKAEGRYESANIRKVYWVDNNNNNRYMIIDTLIGTTPGVEIFEFNPSATLNAPTVITNSGGGYKSGMVQYSYQLYIKNGARTTFAPCSNMVTLSGGDSSTSSSDNVGTGIGVNTGKSCIITIPSIDADFTRARIVALYYTEFGINPVVNVIAEVEYDSAITNLIVIDPGTTIYDTIPLEEFRLLGQADYKSDSLASKNNYLFFGNNTKSRWNPAFLDPTDLTFWDSRAVRFRDWNETVTHTDTESTPADYTSAVIAIAYATDNSVLITIPDFTTTVASGRTIIDVTDAESTVVAAPVVNGTYTDSVPQSLPYSISEPNYTITGITWSDPDLTFTITNTVGNIFIDYVGITNGTIHDFKFTYTWSEIVNHKDAKVWDGVSPYTIDKPVGAYPTAAQWDTAHWDNFQTAYDHDAVNLYNNIAYDDNPEYAFKYGYDCAALGASGKNVNIHFPTPESLMIDTNTEEERVHVNTPFSSTAADTYKRSSMRNEVYRMYIVFYNTKMQYSNPQWICDLRMPTVGESPFIDLDTEIYAKYLYPRVVLYNIPTDPDLLGWQIFRCERKDADKSILMRGLLSTSFDDTVHIRSYTSDTSPYVFIRAEDIDTYVNVKDVVEFVAPEITFNKNISRIAGDKIRIDGRYSYDVATSNPSVGGSQFLYWLKTKDVSAPSASDTLLYGISDSQIFSDSQANAGGITSYTYSLIGGEQFQHNVQHLIGGIAHYGKIGTTMLLALDDDITVDDATTGYILASYMRDVHSSRYGGITYEARSYNQVIPFSSFIPKATDNAYCYYGDTFIHFYTYLKAMFFDGDVNRYQTVVNIATETTIDLFHRLDPIQKYINPMFSDSINPTAIYGINEKFIDGVNSYPNTYPVELGDLYRQNMVYSQSGTAQMIQCKVFDSNNVETLDTEIISTGVKVNNEYFDNWTNVLTNNTIWLDPKYGAIRNIFTLNNSLFAGQDKGIAQISVQERSMIQDNSKMGLVLGTGEVLSRYDYLTTTSGFQNYYDMCLSDKSFYYLDRRNKIIYQMTQEGDKPISEILGYRSYMKSFGAITTVKTGYDPIYKEVFFYISDGSLSGTSVLNEYTQTFVSKQSFTPHLMFGLNENFFSITGYRCYLHNYGNYGVFYGAAAADSTVTVLINPNKEIVNRYDILDLRVDVTSGATYYDTEQFDHIDVNNSNTSQTFTKALTTTGSDVDTAKSITRKWRVWLIPSDLATDFFRMVDTYVKVKLTRHNTGNKKITLHDITTYYRPTRS